MSRSVPFDETSALVEAVLRGQMRQTIVAEAASAKSAAQAMTRLRDGMRADVWGSGRNRVDLAAAIAAFDQRVRAGGFHAIHDWDGKAERVNEDTIAIEVVNYAIEHRGEGAPDGRVLAMLLDYYFLYILALLSLNVWEDGDADARLDRLDGLLVDLQGANGSGQRLASDAATLMLLATSHYESDDRGYDTLLAQVRTLGSAQRRKIARVHALCLGSHLRFGIEATYGQDYLLMRDDNSVDYRWLSFSLATMMDEYDEIDARGEAGAARDLAVEALLNGLSADPEAFVGTRPLVSLEASAAEHSRLRDRLIDSRQALGGAFQVFRPRDDRYSPLSLFFNFSQNVLKGVVIDAILWGEPWAAGFNDLLTSRAADAAENDAKMRLARALMKHAREKPDRIRGLLTPAIVYDARAGRRAFGAVQRALAASVAAGRT
jgi:hypothetical protein